MNDGSELSNQMNESNYQMSNSRQMTTNNPSTNSGSSNNNQSRNSMVDRGIGTRVMRNANDWKWGKQVKH